MADIAVAATLNADGGLDLSVTVPKERLAELLAPPPVDPPADPPPAVEEPPPAETPPVVTDPPPVVTDPPPVVIDPPPATTPPVETPPAAPAPTAMGIAAAYDAAAKKIRVTGTYVSLAPVLVYFAATGKPLGVGTGTGVTTLAAKAAGTPFVFGLSAAAGSYDILCVHGVLNERVTVDVPAAPVIPPPSIPTPPAEITPVTPPAQDPPPVTTPPVETPPVATDPPPVTTPAEPPATTPPVVPPDAIATPLATSKVDVPARLVSFGRTWAPGQLADGLANGEEAVQVDVLMRHPDGSPSFTMLTMTAPAVAAGDKVACPLVPHTKPAAAPIDMNSVTVPLQVKVTVAGTPYTLDVGAALKAPAAFAAPTSSELSGPLVSDRRVELPIINAMRLVVDARAYADNRQWLDVQVHNDLTLGKTGGDVTYDVEITYAGAVVFSRTGIHQWQYTTWHREFWSDATPVHHIMQDAGEMIATGFVMPYDLKVGAHPSTVKPVTGPQFDILGSGDMPQYMGSTGVGPYIGADPGWGAAYVMLQTEEAKAYALANSDAAGSIPWHFWVAADQSWVDVTKHPNLWMDNRGVVPNGQLTQALPLRNGTATAAQLQSGWTLDAAHQPSTHWLPAIYTGSRYRRDLLAAQAAWAIASMNPAKGYREGAQGIIATSQTQVRAIAWSLVAVARAAALCRDQGAYFQQILANNLTYLQNKIAAVKQGEALFWVPGQYGEPDVIAPWQQDYVGLALIQIVQLGNQQAREVFRAMIGYLSGRIIAMGVDGLTYNCSTFKTVTATVNGVTTTTTTVYDTWAAIHDATAAKGLTSGKGPAPNGWKAADGTPWPPNTFMGYYLAALAVQRYLEKEFPDDPRPAQARAFLTANALMATPAQFALQPNYSLA